LNRGMEVLQTVQGVMISAYPPVGHYASSRK
jgi:hypothetical protein